MSILSIPVVADTLARVLAATVNPTPKAAVRFADIPGRTSQATILTRYGPVAATLYHPLCVGGRSECGTLSAAAARLAEKLHAAGSLIEYHEVTGVDHGYNIMSGALDVTRAVYSRIARHVARARGSPSPSVQCRQLNRVSTIASNTASS